jgi:hypothetical protein
MGIGYFAQAYFHQHLESAEDEAQAEASPGPGVPLALARTTNKLVLFYNFLVHKLLARQ